MSLFNLLYLNTVLRAAAIAVVVLAAIAPSVRASSFQPPDDTAPRESTGGASRTSGLCPEDPIGSDALVPLIPDTNHGYTVSDRPTIFVYVPETTASEAYFSLEDEDYMPVFQTTVPVPAGGGLVAISVPESAPTLEADKDYRWMFTLKCSDRIRAGYPLVGGWISRYDGNVNAQGSPAEMADAYGRAGIWYDGLAALALAVQSEPDNQALVANLEEFLSSAGVQGAIARF